MDFVVIEAEQRSPEWAAARAGRLTGSRAHLLFVKGRGGKGESTQRRDYRLQLVSERIAREPQEEPFLTFDVRRGMDLEPKAFARCEALTGQVVRKTGFLAATGIQAGCSLDGDVDEFTGIIELKCPKMATHLAYRADPASFIEEYRAQVTHNLWISGAKYCDLCSFDDRVPEKLQLLKVRIEREDVDLIAYETAALAFLAEVEQVYQAIMDGAYL